MDLRGRSSVGGVQRVIAEAEDLAKKKAEYRQQVERLATYVWKSARHRIQQIKKGEMREIQQTIQAEIALSSANGRLDLVHNLLERHALLLKLEKEIEVLEREDYQKRFGISSD